MKRIAIGLVILFIGASGVPSMGWGIEKTDSLTDIEANVISEESLVTFGGNIIYVDDDNVHGPWYGTPEHPFQFIQDGINAANTGDTVFVFSGIYYEQIFVNKNINLIGDDQDTTIIFGYFGNVVSITANGVYFRGFTVQIDDWWDRRCAVMRIESNDNIITGNTIIDYSEDRYFARFGLLLKDSLNNTIVDNTFLSIGISLSGDSLDYWNTHTIENNTVNGRPIRYYKDRHEHNMFVVPSDTAQVILANCTNFAIHNLNMLHVDSGIQLGFSSYNNISGNTIANNSYHSIHLTNSSYNNIVGNTLLNYIWSGIYLDVSSNNNIADNRITITIIQSCWDQVGIFLCFSDNNTIHQNIIANNLYENICLYGPSNNNIISGNMISGGENWGIFLSNYHISFPEPIAGPSGNLIIDNYITAGWHGIGLSYDSPSNIIINNTITNNSHYGVEVQDSPNCIISGNTIANNDDSMRIYRDSNNTHIFGNTITGDINGLHFWGCSGMVITNNTFDSGGINVGSAWSLDECNTHIIENNTIDNRPIRYYKDMDSVIVPSDTAQLILANCTSFTIQDLNLTDINSGIQLSFSPLNTIKENTIENSMFCIRLTESPNNTIVENTLTNIFCGVYIYSYFYESSYNVVEKNSITNQVRAIMLSGPDNTKVVDNTITNGIYNGIDDNNGIRVTRSTNSTISRNIIADNMYGIELWWQCNDNVISENRIENNTDKGIYIWGSGEYSCNNNRIYHNNFINNTQHAYDVGINIWNNSYPSGGNYWEGHNNHDGYQGASQTISGSDGIVDQPGGGLSPYDISGDSNQDLYPLMNHFVLGDVNVDGRIDAFDIDPFVLALTNPDEYMNQYSMHPILHGDINQDGRVDSFDIDPFVQLLIDR